MKFRELYMLIKTYYICMILNDALKVNTDVNSQINSPKFLKQFYCNAAEPAATSPHETQRVSTTECLTLSLVSISSFEKIFVRVCDDSVIL